MHLSFPDTPRSCKPARCVTYRENSQTNRLFQVLCTNPSTVNNTLMNSRHFYCVLETIKGESIVFCNCAFPDEGPVRAETCSSCRIITWLWFSRIVCIIWFTLWHLNHDARNGKCKKKKERKKRKNVKLPIHLYHSLWPPSDAVG
jgi:hypothetical protein